MGLWAWYKRMICNKRKKENKPKKSEAKKSLNRVQGTSKFQALVEADALTKQALSALDRIHFWSKIQCEIRSRRLCMVTESRIKQKKLQNHLKLESKLHELEVEWCGGPGTMDEIVSKIHQREEASSKRERAMAYAFSHQRDLQERGPQARKEVPKICYLLSKGLPSIIMVHLGLFGCTIRLAFKKQNLRQKDT